MLIRPQLQGIQIVQLQIDMIIPLDQSRIMLLDKGFSRVDLFINIRDAAQRILIIPAHRHGNHFFRLLPFGFSIHQHYEVISDV